MDNEAGSPRTDPSGPVRELGTVFESSDPTLYPDTVAESARPRRTDVGKDGSTTKELFSLDVDVEPPSAESGVQLVDFCGASAASRCAQLSPAPPLPGSTPSRTFAELSRS